jgi:UDP-N-acetylmuramate dehydrogenase
MEFVQNFSLKKYNSFGINIIAKNFTCIKNTEDIVALESFYNKPHFILGGGSNILFTKNFDGLVIKNEINGIEIIKEDEEHIFVKAGAGVVWHDFVLYCIENNFAGVENLSLIPGTVGASPIQNIGAYGVELKDVFYSVEFYDITEKCFKNFNLNDCAFGYRESIFKKELKGKSIISSVIFKLNKKPNYNITYGTISAELEKISIKNLSIKAISDAVISIRQSKLPNPAVLGNAGSFFKNPTISNIDFENLKSNFPNIVGYSANDNDTKLAAGWLIEQCGFKGYRKADAGCHALQALVLVNYGNASGAEILNLSNEIIEAVRKKFNVELEREVNVL